LSRCLPPPSLPGRCNSPSMRVLFGAAVVAAAAAAALPPLLLLLPAVLVAAKHDRAARAATASGAPRSSDDDGAEEEEQQLKRAAAAAAAAAAAGGRRPWEAPARRRPPTYAPLLLTPLASPPLNLWPVLVFHCTALAFASLAAAATDRSPWLNSEVCWPSCWYGQADPSGHGLRARAMAAASRPASPNKKNSQGWHQRADPVWWQPPAALRRHGPRAPQQPA
jgi:hypothetical protein